MIKLKKKDIGKITGLAGGTIKVRHAAQNAMTLCLAPTAAKHLATSTLLLLYLSMSTIKYAVSQLLLSASFLLNTHP